MISRKSLLVGVLAAALIFVVNILSGLALFGAAALSILTLILFSPFYVKSLKGHRLSTYAVLLLFLALTFKSFHWPGAGLFAILSVLLFAFVYAPITYLYRQRSSSLWVRIFGMLCLMAVSLGWIFKFQHWAGANILFMVSLPSWFAFLVIIFLFGGHKKLKFSRIDIVVHVVFFSLASQLLVSKNVRIKTDSDLTQTYLDSKAELENSMHEITVLKRLFPNRFSDDPLIKSSLSLQKEIQQVRSYYRNSILSEIESGGTDLVDSLSEANLSGESITYMNDHILFKNLTPDTINELREPLAALIAKLETWATASSQDQAIQLMMEGNVVMNPFHNKKVGELEFQWYNIWFETPHGKYPREMLGFLNMLELNLLVIMESKVLHDLGNTDLSHAKASLFSKNRSFGQRFNENTWKSDSLYAQFNLILLFLIIVFIAYMTFAPMIKNHRVFQSLTFLLFVLLFEFVLFLSMPYWENKYGNNLIILFAANALMAMLLVPVHNYFENMLFKRFGTKESEEQTL